ncbi:DUF1992 domain-containing protein [Thalassorhabdomicrobium marinisediminis]|uniref:DUF1992 domain-containing protein n=1 Tax=Thalassorhabdomicrobium marinisediminis TaxID=2170577 RepID=UPI0024903CA7|nr:DUF1992 domain-containing protein [Thalassorhabdomicrobium marinisediminis]
MFKSLIDRAFGKAQSEGALEDLPGQGKPIEPASLNSDPFAHVYKESGVMSPFGHFQREIDALRHELAEVSEPQARRKLQTRIAELETRKAIEMETWKRYS